MSLAKVAILMLVISSPAWADTVMCGSGTVFDNAILPLLAYASLVTGILIALSYMAGTAFSNPKLTLWSKTEIVQLAISIASVSLIMLAVTTFCSLDMKDIADIFSLPGTHASINVYDAAISYLNDTVTYSHNAM